MIFADGYCIHASAHIPGSLFIGVDGHFNDFYCQFSALGGFSQRCPSINSVPVFSLGTKVGSDIKMDASRTNLSPLQLAARPTMSNVPGFVPYGIGQRCGIEFNSSSLEVNGFFTAFSKKAHCYPSSFIAQSAEFARIPAIKQFPISSDRIAPSIGDCSELTLFKRNIASLVKSNFSERPIIPGGHGIKGGVLPTSSVAYAGKYQSIVECRNLTFVVVWDFRVLVDSPAVSGHGQLIFREVENDNRPRTDLGKCLVSHKHDAHQESFRHVSISSDDMPLLGFRFKERTRSSNTVFKKLLRTRETGWTALDVGRNLDLLGLYDDRSVMQCQFVDRFAEYLRPFHAGQVAIVQVPASPE
jgi:hypothetical protein